MHWLLVYLVWTFCIFIFKESTQCSDWNMNKYLKVLSCSLFVVCTYFFVGNNQVVMFIVNIKNVNLKSVVNYIMSSETDRKWVKSGLKMFRSTQLLSAASFILCYSLFRKIGKQKKKKNWKHKATVNRHLLWILQLKYLFPNILFSSFFLF